MAIGLRLRNKSTGDEETFRFNGDVNDFGDERPTVRGWLARHLPEVSKLVTEENFVSFGDWSEMGIPATYVETAEDVKRFLDRRNADAEWDIPEGMLYVDWLACMSILNDYLDYEYVTYDSEQIHVTEYDVEYIDEACARLTKEGRHLVCHKHVFKDAYSREYEGEVIQ